MEPEKLFLTILGMAGVTYVCRLLPAWWLADRPLPEGLKLWLRHVPAAILAAMVCPALLLQDGQWLPVWDNVYLWGALPVAWVAAKTHSLIGAVLAGMALVWAGRHLFGL